MLRWNPLIGMVIRRCVFLNLANKLPCEKVGVPYTDLKHHNTQCILSTWQDDWNGAVANKIHSVKAVLGEWQSSYRRERDVAPW